MATQFATKEDLAYAAQMQKEVFVAKENGKGLISDEEKTKLAGVQENAQVNVIEQVKVNGTAVNVSDKSINITVPTEEQIQAKINAAVGTAYKVKGSIAFANLPTNAAVGDVYNVSDAFTTTDAFAEGAGKACPAGTNVVWTEDGKWDCMAGTYDFSDFLRLSDVGEITEAEIEAMYKSN